MRPTLKTLALAVLAVALLVLNLLDPGVSPGGSPPTKIISPVPHAQATRIELSTASNKVVLNKDDKTQRWAITSPLTHPADQAMTRAVLHPFRSEIQVDARVDTGNLAEYGLDASGGIVVEIWTNEDTPKVSITIGKDAPGGASFIRFSGDDAVYRAQVGGRVRYERRPSEWRNRVVLDFEESDVQGVSAKPAAGAEVHLSRSPIEGETVGAGPWMVEPDPGWGLDARALKALVAALGQLRAREILADDFDGGFSPPAVELTVVRNDGTEIGMAVGTKVADGLAYVRVTGGAAVYAVPAETLQRFLDMGATPVKAHVLFEVVPAEMARMIYWEGRSSVEVAPDPQTGIWRPVTEGVRDVDVTDVQWALGQMARLLSDGPAEGVNLVTGGVVPPNMVFEIQRQNGSHEAIYVGRATQVEGKSFYYVAKQNTRDVHLMSAERIARLQRAFGKR